MKKLSFSKINKFGKAAAFIDYNVGHPTQICWTALPVHIICCRSFTPFFIFQL